MSEWVIVIREPGQPERTIPATAGTVFGRNPRCSCVLKDPAVSGSHARLVMQSGALAIEDLGSQNKTRILGGPSLKLGQVHRLESGSEVRIGETTLEVRGPKPSATPADTSPPTRQAMPTQPGAGATPRPADDLDGQPTMLGAGPPGGEPTTARKRPGASAPPPRTTDEPDETLPAAAHAAPKPPAPPPPAPRTAARPAAERVQRMPGSTLDALGHQELGVPGGPQATIEFGNVDSQSPFAQLATDSTLKQAKARLVLAGQADRGVHPILVPVLTVGRGADCECRVSHPAVSTPHARIVFDTQVHRFFVEDAGSRNHTYLDGKLVAPGARHELSSDAHLRFGPIDALFVVDLDPDGARTPREHYDFAGQLLVRKGTITAEQRKAAMKEVADDDKHLGEVLLLAKDPISVRQWIDALDQARVALLHRELTQRDRKVWLIVAAALIFVALAWYLLK